MAETAFEIATRGTIERDIVDSQNKGDGNQVNAKLDIFPYGKPRKELGVVALYQTLERKGSKAARFFEKEAIAEASQETDEIPVVTQEMVDAA
jgi:hypothetical protein